MDADIVALATSVRHTIHANPELGFQEFHTQALVRDTLLTAGVSPECIRVAATTGLVVDIAGRCVVNTTPSRAHLVATTALPMVGAYKFGRIRVYMLASP